MATFSLTKDADAKLDYTVDWSAWLAEGDTISAATFVMTGTPTPPTVYNTSFDGTTTTFWLSGGVDAGSGYLLTIHVTTAAGREDDRSITINVAER